MADKRISELDSYTSTLGTDVIPIFDITNGVTKKTALDFLLPPRFRWTTDFPSGVRFNENAYLGSVTYDANGVTLACEESAGCSVYTRFDLGATFSAVGPIGNPTFSTSFALLTSGTDFTFLFCNGKQDMTASTPELLDKHIGFKIIRTDSGTIQLFATQADGSTETVSSALTTIAPFEYYELMVRVNGTTSVDYYWANKGGAWNGPTTLTTNIPTGYENWLFWGLGNQNTASISSCIAFTGSYER